MFPWLGLRNVKVLNRCVDSKAVGKIRIIGERVAPRAGSGLHQLSLFTRTPAQYAFDGSCRADRVDRPFFLIESEVIHGPFPCIAMHVEKAEGIRRLEPNGVDDLTGIVLGPA